VPSPRRFPPPWSVEETDACFIVSDGKGQALAYAYFDHPRRGPAHRRQVAKLPELLRLWLWPSMEALPCCSVRL